MSKVFNMVGGGGGKNISSIIITGLESTDTVTCTKDGKSYAATWDEAAQHWEIVGLPLGTFTVTATNGTNTTTETVLIDIAGVYEVEMDFNLWLYRDGDECEDVTGGWSSDGCLYRPNRPLVNCSISGGKLILPPTEYPPVAVISTVNKIDMIGYSVLKYESTQSANGCSFQIATDKGAIYDTNVLGLAEDNLPVGNNIITTIDISALTESAYPCFSRGSTAATTYISKVWLER